MLWSRAVRRAPMTPLPLVLAGAAGSAADFGDQDLRGLTHTVIGSLIVRGNRLAISNSSSLSGCELRGSSLRARLPPILGIRWISLSGFVGRVTVKIPRLGVSSN